MGDKFRGRKDTEEASAKEISVMRGVLGTCQWRAQQQAPQYAAEVGLLLSTAASATIKDLKATNKLARDMRHHSKMRLRFHHHDYQHWTDLVQVLWADASEGNRHDGSSTCGYVGGVTGKNFKSGKEDDVDIVSWRAFKAPRKVAGSNGAESQAIEFAEEALWLQRLMWCEVHGVRVERWKWNSIVKLVGGILITDSRGIYDGLTRHESPQLKLRSLRGGEELGAAKQQILATDVEVRWVNGMAELADAMTKAGTVARKTFGEYLINYRWKCSYDERFEAGKKRQARGAGRHAETAEASTLMEDDNFSENLKALLKEKYSL